MPIITTESILKLLKPNTSGLLGEGSIFDEYKRYRIVQGNLNKPVKHLTDLFKDVGLVLFANMVFFPIILLAIRLPQAALKLTLGLLVSPYLFFFKHQRENTVKILTGNAALILNACVLPLFQVAVAVGYCVVTAPSQMIQTLRQSDYFQSQTDKPFENGGVRTELADLGTDSTKAQGNDNKIESHPGHDAAASP